MNLILLEDPRWEEYFPSKEKQQQQQDVNAATGKIAAQPSPAIRNEGNGDQYPAPKRLKEEVFETEFSVVLPGGDPRTRHITHHLRKQTGERVRVGFIDGGPIGEAVVTMLESDTASKSKHKAVRLQIDTSTLRLPLGRPRIHLVLAISFPKVIQQLWPIIVSLGVDSILYLPAALTNAEYLATSSLTPVKYGPSIREGLAQAVDTRVPTVCILRNLKQASLLQMLQKAPMNSSDPSIRTARSIMALEDASMCKVALHVGSYPSIRQCFIRSLSCSMNDKEEHGDPPDQARNFYRGMVLAIGPERGWTDEEVHAFAQSSFQLASLGPPVLKTETAVVAAISLAQDILQEQAGTSPIS